MTGPLPRAQQPLTMLQANVLKGVTTNPSTAFDIAARCGVAKGRVGSALLYLQGKDLVQKTSDGWRLA